MLNHTAIKPIISVAPMMNCTDRHARYFLRLIAPDVRLYTEMITTQALVHNHPKRFLAFDAAEKYVALQLGGSDAQQLSYCAKLGEEFGYDEVNLNVGCPSERVKSGQFGACLMLNPQLVADCVAAMQSKIQIPVTVKCRIGVDDQDSYAALHHFITLVASAGCQHFIVHARKAWLSGLSPKENREIPPLQYDIVYQLKRDFPNLIIIINGGIKNIVSINEHIQHVDGMMIGRAAYANPYFLAAIQQHYFTQSTLSRVEIIQKLIPYVQNQLSNGVRLNSITRHILGIFQGERGAAAWRRHLSQNTHYDHADASVIMSALSFVKEQTC